MLLIKGIIVWKGNMIMDEEIDDIRGYQRLVRAIIIKGIKDMVLPYGTQNSKSACCQAFNFLFNENI